MPELPEHEPSRGVVFQTAPAVRAERPRVLSRFAGGTASLALLITAFGVILLAGSALWTAFEHPGQPPEQQRWIGPPDPERQARTVADEPTPPPSVSLRTTSNQVEGGPTDSGAASGPAAGTGTGGGSGSSGDDSSGSSSGPGSGSDDDSSGSNSGPGSGSETDHSGSNSGPGSGASGHSGGGSNSGPGSGDGSDSSGSGSSGSGSSGSGSSGSGSSGSGSGDDDDSSGPG